MQYIRSTVGDCRIIEEVERAEEEAAAVAPIALHTTAAFLNSVQLHWYV